MASGKYAAMTILQLKDTLRERNEVGGEKHELIERCVNDNIELSMLVCYSMLTFALYE